METGLSRGFGTNVWGLLGEGFVCLQLTAEKVQAIAGKPALLPFRQAKVQGNKQTWENNPVRGFEVAEWNSSFLDQWSAPRMLRRCVSRRVIES